MSNNMSDEDEFIERLEKGSLAYISESGPVYNGPTWAESKAYEIIKRLTNLVSVLEENQAEYVGTITKLECQVVDLTAERDEEKEYQNVCIATARRFKDRAEAAEKRIAELEAQNQQAMETLDRLAEKAQRYVDASEEYFSDTTYDANGLLAEAHAELHGTLYDRRRSRAALKGKP